MSPSKTPISPNSRLISPSTNSRMSFDDLDQKQLMTPVKAASASSKTSLLPLAALKISNGTNSGSSSPGIPVLSEFNNLSDEDSKYENNPNHYNQAKSDHPQPAPTNEMSDNTRKQPHSHYRKVLQSQKPKADGFEFDISLDEIKEENPDRLPSDNKELSQGIKEGDVQPSKEIPSNILVTPPGGEANHDNDIVPTSSDPISKSSNKSPNIETDEDQILLAKHLTSLFLDTRRVLRAEHNIVDPLEDTSYINNISKIERGSRDSSSNVVISRDTIIRAEKVKSSIGLKYMYIQRIYDWSKLHQEDSIHSGIEGVYNPLQVIRNRKIRAKHKESIRPLSIKTLPLACNVFSSKNSGEHKKNWHMLWAIELSEFVFDKSWRTEHWNELKKPNGELWFPSPASYSSSLKKNKPRRRDRLHDKLFKEDLPDDSESLNSISQPGSQFDSEKGKKIKERRLSSIQSSSSDKSRIFQLSRSKSNNASKKKTLSDKVKKKLYGANISSSSWSSDEEVDASKQSNSDDSPIKVFKKLPTGPRSTPNLPLLKTSSNSENTNKHIFTIDSSANDSKATNGVPAIKVDSNDDSTEKSLDINKITFKPVESKRIITGGDLDLSPTEQVEDEVNLKYNTLTDEFSNVKSAPVLRGLKERQLSIIDSRLNYIDKNLFLKLNFLINIHPQLLDRVDSKLDDILQNHVQNVFQSTVQINDDILPAYETLFNGFLNEIKSLIHVVNENYAVRIDNLLSNSDRSIGEINTSLSLELRKVNEKLDKLNVSLFSNIVTETLKDNDLTMNFSESGNYKVLYFCLENLIVILLRLVWVVVNIYKFFVNILKLFWKIITFPFL